MIMINYYYVNKINKKKQMREPSEIKDFFIITFDLQTLHRHENRSTYAKKLYSNRIILYRPFRCREPYPVL